MRLLEIEIELFDKLFRDEHSVVDSKECEKSRAFIDLDCVESVYDNLEGDIVIFIQKSCSYATKSYTLDEFAKIWKNEDEMERSELKEDLRCDAEPTCCPDCNGTEMVCQEGKTTCQICGRVCE